MRFWAILWVCLFSSPALAIINIEELRMDESEAGWQMSTTLNLSGQRGNIDEDKFALNGASQWISDDLNRRYLLLLSSAVDRAEGFTYSEEYFAHVRRTRQLTENWGWELFAQYQKEPLNNSYRRELLGTNARYRLQQTPFNGHAGMGIMYERRSVTPLIEGRKQANDWRFNFYLDSVYPLSENSEWAVGFYVQPRVDNMSDVRSIVNMGLTSRVTRLFSLTLDISFNNESNPLDGQSYSHWEYATGLNIRF
ncbi:DUF481 domain-containing protein [Aliidiomarina minuta]|nr:DUF481 domain-containing protein [Aliidiomarina minuta]